MKTVAKKAAKKATPAKKRDLFAEISSGFDALAQAREGKTTLRTHKVEFKAAPKVTSKDVARLRKRLDLSQVVFATRLRTNVTTVRNWEQDRSGLNSQAKLLIKLVEKYPDTLDRIAQL